MTSMWDYRQDAGRAERDLVGFDVVATDGGIGKVDEASNKAGSAYLVVDTGFWIFGKKRMIPAGVVERVDDRDGTVHVNMSKADIKSAPDLHDQDRHVRDSYDTYYEPFGRS